MSRYAPTRAGVINLWDYRDEEFVFANGWLVLRGPNGSGKTKALEVLFPFVLDGRIEPRRLNPFASEERTMKSNLLFRGQESALGYVWLEFGNGQEHVTVGVGLRAQRHNDKVTRWYFVADGRVGVDFSLLDDEDRPLVRKNLVAQLGADAVRDNAEEHRAAVDARLFGLGRDRYEQLLNLVLTLRRPQLAKHLDPASLSETLADGLRPLDEDLLTEAARSFDDMESVQKTLDGLVAADEATRAFLAIYTTYLRTHARAACDKVTARRGTTQLARQRLAQASAAHRSTTEEQQRTAAELARATQEPPRLRAHLERLKLSDVYKSLGQLEDLERLVRQLAAAVERAEAALAKQRTATQRRSRELAEARQKLADRRSDAARAVRTLAQEAEVAAIPWGPADAEAQALPARAAAAVTARRNDITMVRQAVSQLDRARAERDHAASALAVAKADAERAERAEQQAAQAVQQARADATERLQIWAQRHTDLLAALQITGALSQLEEALASAGEPDAPTPQAAFAEAAAVARQRLRDMLAQLRSRRSDLDGEIGRVSAERAAVAAERDDAPTPWPARPASRQTRAGAPLWRLVRFADGLTDADAAGVEAALEAAGMLDAWISPDDELSEDGFLRPLPEAQRPSGATLADVLAAEEQDDVPAQRVRDVLLSISLDEVTGVGAGAPRIDTAGRFTTGVLIGAFTKPAPEFIGATARARRRQLRLEEFDRRLQDLAGTREGLDAEVKQIESTLERAATAEREVPQIGAIVAALREHHQKAVHLQTKLELTDAATARHETAMAATNAAEIALRRVCAERSLPADQLDEVANAVVRFERCTDHVIALRRECAVADEHVTAAGERLDEAAEMQAEAEGVLQTQQQRYAVEAEQVRTLRSAVEDPQAQAILADIEATTSAVERAERAEAQARDADVAAQKAVTARERDVDSGERELHTAVQEEQAEAQLLSPFAHPDLLALLGCPSHLRWPAHTDRGEELPAEIVALHEEILAATKELTPTETSLKQSATRLHRALDDLHNQLSSAGQDYRPEHDSDGGILIIRVADEDGYAPIKVFADRIGGHRRDQEMMLTEAERRILEDTLLSSLARQIQQRTVDARDLVDAMDHEMRKRQMSSGLTIGVGWQLADNLDEEQRSICKLLELDPARLGPSDLESMRRHFASRIKTSRAARGDRSYRELLADVLDYRRWRFFAFRLHRIGRNPESLTKARHSQLSGGEQSVSLHLPLFAAAHALFTSARATCPRLLALDEAFAGVDETGRSELLALANQFNLDLFMTGYDLWATHAAVPACAHYDLSHSPAEHLVSAMLMVWDGAETLADFDGALASALGSPGTRGGSIEVTSAPSASDASEQDDVLL